MENGRRKPEIGDRKQEIGNRSRKPERETGRGDTSRR
jgi:hypothetical protein